MLDCQDTHILRFPPEEPPILAVVVDTEAEFQWGRPFTREQAGVSNIRHQIRAQRLFDRYDLRPSYIVDYPVASSPEAYLPLREIHQDGRCEIGAHLQPWSNPPFDETLSERNSFVGNLPEALERAKLDALTQAIRRNFGVTPRMYKAGRYGVGLNTARILAENGYDIDLSVLPRTDLRPNGQDFGTCPADPYWFEAAGRRLLEVPMTIGFTGLLSKRGKALHDWTTDPGRRWMRLPGILARLRLLDRVTLTPEGITFDELRRLTLAMHARGKRVFSFTYHSPSLDIGHTPYVRSQADLDAFLGKIERYLDFFMGEMGGRAMTPIEIFERASGQDRASSKEKVEAVP